MKAQRWSAGIVAPLAAFMALVWIGIVGRAPAEIAAGEAGSRAAAAAYVAVVCMRLFIIAFAVQAAFLHFAGWTPLAFVRALAAPPVVKKLLVLTLSLIETMLHAIDRARTALIAAGIITRRMSWRNLAQRLAAGADRVAHRHRDRDRAHARQMANGRHALAPR